MPAYLRVAESLRSDITSGELGEGSQLPSLAEIALRFGVGRGVAERAVGQLRAEGLVVTRQGGGSFVRKYATIRRVSPDRLLRSVWDVGQAIQDQDLESREPSVAVEIGEVAAPDWVAEPMGINPGELVGYRERAFVVDGRRVQLATSYEPVDLARGTAFMHTDTGPGGVYRLLSMQGLPPTNFVESIEARVPTQYELERLDFSHRAAIVFQITRQAWHKGRCVEVNRMVLDAAVYELVYKFDAE